MKPFPAWCCSFLPVFASAFFLAGISALCSGCYTLKQGVTMLNYLGRAVPLEKLAAASAASAADGRSAGAARADGTSEDDIRFVQRVMDIRRFAQDELGLTESKNYTRYVELDRDYLAAVVSASAKDSFTRHEWWFPVVGKVPYKGFFNVGDARKERAKLEKKDLDVWVRGVDAFSTLGWFRDPLYSYMKEYSEKYLADLIIHELLHATVYLKNHSQFNEELAEFVGTEGARLYMEKRGDGKPDESGKAGGAVPSTDSTESAADTGRAGGNPSSAEAGGAGNNPSGAEETTASIDAAQAAADADRDAFLAFIRNLIAELDEVYQSGIPREEKLSRKKEIIEGAKADFAENYDAAFKTENYRGFSDLPVNNAYLELYRLYHGEDRYFAELYEKSGNNLLKFIAAAKTLGQKRGGISAGEDPREAFERALNLR